MEVLMQSQVEAALLDARFATIHYSTMYGEGGQQKNASKNWIYAWILALKRLLSMMITFLLIQNGLKTFSHILENETSNGRQNYESIV